MLVGIDSHTLPPPHTSPLSRSSSLPPPPISRCSKWRGFHWACAATSHTQAERHACGTRNSSPLVYLRHNKQEWNCEAADSPLRIPSDARARGREGKSARGPWRRGFPTGNPFGPDNKDSRHCNTWLMTPPVRWLAQILWSYGSRRLMTFAKYLWHDVSKCLNNNIK